MLKKPALNFTILEYDIETSPLKANVWRLGEQRVGHHQLDPKYSMYKILTIAYKWYHESDNKTVVLVGDNAVEAFDKVARKADVLLGKNSDRFDVKHINTQRMLQGLAPLPEWANCAEDLEKQLRKFFVFPSQSLEYVSKLLTGTGKDKMEFSDWTDIVDMNLIKELLTKLSKPETRKIVPILIPGKTLESVLKLGEKSLAKMIKYNKRDVIQTERVLVRVLPHIKLRHNASTSQEGQGCILCGSLDLSPTKIVEAGKTRYQEFHCHGHEGYGGRATWFYKKGAHTKTFSKMG